MGLWVGWVAGWAVCTTGILVIGSQADVGARHFYLLIGADSAAASKGAVMALAVIVLMTAICVVGHRCRRGSRT